MSRAPDELDRLWARFRDLAEGSVADRPRAAAIVVGSALLFCGALAFAPALVVNDMPQDALIPLDGAWRLSQGQWPHRDFYTPLGDLYYAALAVAAWLRGPLDPRLLAVANALVALPVLALAWVASRDRLPEPVRGLLVLSVTLLAASPRTLDSVGHVGFNAMYNRWGWALCLVVAVVALLPGRRRPIEAAVVALCVLAAFWIKITFAALAVGLAALAVLVVPDNRRTVGAGLLVGLVGVGAGAATPLGRAYLADLATAAAAGASGPGVIRVDRLLPVLDANRPLLVAAVLVALALIRTSRDDAEERAATRATLGVGGLLVGSVVVASQNNDQAIPLLVVPLLVGVAALHARRHHAVPLAALGASLVLGWSVWLDGRAVLSHLAMGLGRTVPLYDDAESPLSRVRIPDVRGSDRPEPLVDQVVSGRIPGDVYDNVATVAWDVDNPLILADAVALLERHGLDDRRVASLTFAPFFPYLLATPPPRGLPAWWDWQRTFGDDWDARACDALADTEVVLAPKVWHIEGLADENAACLDAAFEPVGETALWTLWRRR